MLPSIITLSRLAAERLKGFTVVGVADDVCVGEEGGSSEGDIGGGDELSGGEDVSLLVEAMNAG
jgi:hypothetical protein